MAKYVLACEDRDWCTDHHQRVEQIQHGGLTAEEFFRTFSC
jgi:hypothetical protein